ncbi:MAG: polyphosphate polymerase domain-containing protein [Mariprofundaceae bacterium]
MTTKTIADNHKAAQASTKQVPSHKSKLHFSRFEFKYILPKRLRDQLESELQYFLKFDPYVEAQPDRKYFVRSLYFDDPSLTAFHDKHDGILSRSKFRIRTYTSEREEDIPCFLELKGRHNNLVYKHRVEIEKNSLSTLRRIEGKAVAEHLLKHAGTSMVRDQFEYNLLRKHLYPVALIDYQRRPYISKYDPEFRLTFDDSLHCTQTTALFPNSHERQRQMLSGYTVMEVKFRYHIPSWFHRIIQSFELQRVSISKICEGIETLGIAEDPS